MEQALISREWLSRHAVDYILYVDGGGAISVQIPAMDLWNVMDHSVAHRTFEDGYNYSERNDNRFKDKVTGILKRYTGGLIHFYEYERNMIVDMYVNEKNEEKQKMEDKTTGGILKDAAIRGAKKAGVNQGGEVALNTFKGLVNNEFADQVLDHEMGREIVKGLMAGGILYLAQNTEFIPANANLEEICELMVENATQNVVEPNIEQFMQQLPLMIKQLSNIGDNMTMDFTNNIKESLETEEEKEEKEVESAVEAAAGSHFRDQ